MSAPISPDLRKRIMRAVDESKEKIIDIAKRFEVSKTAIYDWIKRRKETGNTKPVVCREKERKITKNQINQLKEKVLEKPDITLQELKEELDLPVCISRISRILKFKLGLNFKKNFIQR